MPDMRNQYTTFAPDIDYQWLPAMTADTQEPVLLMPFPRKNDATWCSQLTRIQQSIVPMGVASLLPPHGFDFHSAAPFFAVPALDLQPVNPAKLPKIFTRDEIDRLMLTIASAVNRLHLDNILLGAVAPSNILLKTIPAPETAVLTALTDAIDLQNPLCGIQYNLRSEYAAPELLEFIFDIADSSASCMTPACDVFSLGMLYHELLTGSPPAVRRAESCPVPLEEPQISKSLDYPHRQLLRRMLRLHPDKRLQDMSSVIREINRIRDSGDCYVDIHCPAQATQMVLLRTGDVNCFRTPFSPQGEATFGPLLSDQSYTLFCNKKRLGMITFPDVSSGQHLYFDYDQLSDSLLAAPPVTDVPTEEDLAEAPLSAPEEPGLTASVGEPFVLPPPEEAEAGSLPPPEPLPPLPAAGQEPSEAPSDDALPAQEELPAPEPEEEPSRDRTKNAVIRNEVIMPNPPLNNIRVIELLPQGYCRLTLINGGSFRIRAADAHRYGIAHLVEQT